MVRQQSVQRRGFILEILIVVILLFAFVGCMGVIKSCEGEGGNTGSTGGNPTPVVVVPPPARESATVRKQLEERVSVLRQARVDAERITDLQKRASAIENIDQELERINRILNPG